MEKLEKHIIPLVIIIFSAWTAFNLLFQSNDYYSMASIVIAFVSVVLYYKGNQSFDKWVYIWVYMQSSAITYGEERIIDSFPIFFGVGFSLELNKGEILGLYFNALSIALYFLVKYFNVDKPLGKTVTLFRLRKGTFPQIQFPVKGVVEKVAGRDKLTAIYLVKLENQITIRDYVYEYVLLNPKKDSLIQPGKGKQICGLHRTDGPTSSVTKNHNPFMDWVLVEC